MEKKFFLFIFILNVIVTRLQSKNVFLYKNKSKLQNDFFSYETLF